MLISSISFISCFINYIFGKKIYKTKTKIFLILGLLFNLGLLFYFKYANFFFENINYILPHKLPILNVVLPLGSSFFTFQNISYLIDVYLNKIEHEKNILNYCTYITLFPQLIAGPIVRYQDIAKELKKRKENITDFSAGIIKFVIGLGKKVLIADTLYNLCMNLMTIQTSMVAIWILALGFTLQIYYDFSGYSDMAIGLGKMFGFHFPKNFNYPLISSSITEFWRRWHMTLSNFFKDYIYIPLGGNRCSIPIQIRNLLLVWILTGLWHGASWNFIFWGLYFFCFLVFEKWILKKYLKKGFISHIYTFLVILVSFIIFNITDFNQMVIFLKGMIGIAVPIINQDIIYNLSNYFVILILACIGIGPWWKKLIYKLQKGKENKWIDFVSVSYILILFILSIAKIVSNSFQPFIYFRF